MLEKLPEKWKILIDKENIETVGGYFNTKLKTILSEGSTCYTDLENIGIYLCSTNYQNEKITKNPSHASFRNNEVYKHENILFEDFKRLILKEPDELLYDIY